MPGRRGRSSVTTCLAKCSVCSFALMRHGVAGGSRSCLHVQRSNPLARQSWQPLTHSTQTGSSLGPQNIPFKTLGWPPSSHDNTAAVLLLLRRERRDFFQLDLRLPSLLCNAAHMPRGGCEPEPRRIAPTEAEHAMTLQSDTPFARGVLAHHAQSHTNHEQHSCAGRTGHRGVPWPWRGPAARASAPRAAPRRTPRASLFRLQP